MEEREKMRQIKIRKYDGGKRARRGEKEKGKKEGVQEAKRIIEEMTHEYKIGERVNAKIIKIADFGAIASISFNTEGLIHISEIAPFRITSVDKYLKPGDIVPVIIKDVDDKGRFKFSIKDINPNLFQDQK
jgi:polyribonucleotide nucleotidyltransferase